MRKLFISAGHSSKKGKSINGKPIDNGAVGNGYIEGELTVELRDLLCKYLKLLGVKPIVDDNDSILSQTINTFRNLTNSNSVLIDLHWNSFNSKSTGVETLIPENPTDFERSLAEKISKTIGSTLGIPLRGKKGVKLESESQHKRLGWMRLAGENILIEVCFISNPNDMASYQKNKEILAQRLAVVIKDSLEDSKTNYKVQKGDSLTKIATKFRTTVTKIKLDNNLKSDLIQVGQDLKI
jgi:N-acetylmuramoyl-L-alanine amidase